MNAMLNALNTLTSGFKTLESYGVKKNIRITTETFKATTFTPVRLIVRDDSIVMSASAELRGVKHTRIVSVKKGPNSWNDLMMNSKPKNLALISENWHTNTRDTIIAIESSTGKEIGSVFTENFNEIMIDINAKARSHISPASSEKMAPYVVKAVIMNGVMDMLFWGLTADIYNKQMEDADNDGDVGHYAEKAKIVYLHNETARLMLEESFDGIEINQRNF